MKSIWSTAEAESWSRGFSYDDYCTLCERIQWSPVDEEFYQGLCDVFEEKMVRDVCFD